MNNKNIKYLLNKTAEYERLSTRLVNAPIKKEAALPAVAAGLVKAVTVIGYLMFAGMGVNVINNHLEMGDANKATIEQLNTVIENLSGVISDNENTPEFSGYKERCKKFLNACIEAKKNYLKLFGEAAAKDPKTYEYFLNYMEAANTISELSGYVVAAINKMKGWKESASEIAGFFGLGRWTETKVVTTEKAISYLGQQMALELPTLQEKFKAAGEEAKKIAEKAKANPTTATTNAQATPQNKTESSGTPKIMSLEELGKSLG